MTILDAASALTNPGSLLSHDGRVVAPYDLEVSNSPAEGYRALSRIARVRNANVSPFIADYSEVTKVHVINGMGVTLGDSIIGLTALQAIKKKYPQVTFTIYRPRLAPTYVQRMYDMGAPFVGSAVDLPVRIADLPIEDLQIDLGNHLFWSQFASIPMIDFFLSALGVTTTDFASHQKSNDWLKLIESAPLYFEHQPDGYVLFCPSASTPVRSIPSFFWVDAVSALWEKYRLPVLGFGNVNHPHYRDISSNDGDISIFISWIKGAHALMTSDTSAVHIAAGFGIPTLAMFTTISSEMRVRDYKECTAIDLLVPGIGGIHASNRSADLDIVHRAYRQLMMRDWATNLPL
jgi:hypothetical protein